MSREIKFRAWDKVRKEFLSGGRLLISIEPGNQPKQNNLYLDILTYPNKYNDRFILMQYTGLTDKNGKEIYEGDILYVEITDSNIGRVIASDNTAVKYKDGMFGVDWGTRKEFTNFNGFYNTTFEVIGNIYENSELLQEAMKDATNRKRT